MIANEIGQDAFNLLCGKKLGEGTYREVYECKIRPELVVKIETNTDWREFANVHEMKFWCDNRHAKLVAEWLAPCHYLSPDGRILLQERVEVFHRSSERKPPEKMPRFLADRKRENFGWLNGRFVCCDYAITIISPSLALTPAGFDDD